MPSLFSASQTCSSPLIMVHNQATQGPQKHTSASEELDFSDQLLLKHQISLNEIRWFENVPMRQSASSQMPLPRMFNCMLLQLQTVIRFIWRAHCAWVRSLQWLQWKMRLGFFHNRNKRRVWFTHSVAQCANNWWLWTESNCHWLMNEVLMSNCHGTSCAAEVADLQPPKFDDEIWMASCCQVNSMSRFAAEYLSISQLLPPRWVEIPWTKVDPGVCDRSSWMLGGIIRGPQHWPSTN